MSTTDKPKKPSKETAAEIAQQAVKSAKKSAKDRRAEAERRRQRNQQILLAVIAVVGLIAVVGAIVISSRPVEATISTDVQANFAKLPGANLRGTTPEGYPFLGAANAPVVLEEFASFACPVCKNYHETYFLNLLDKMQAGQLKLIVIPLTKIDFATDTATQGALCAGQQGKFWEMHEVLYDWQSRYATGMNDMSRLKTAASTLGLDSGKFSDCMGSDSQKKVIDAAQKLADARAVPGTPTVYLDGKKIDVGNPDVNGLRGYIEAAAKGKS